MKVYGHISKLFTVAILIFVLNSNAFSQELVSQGKIDRGNFHLHYKIFGDTGSYALILGGGPGSTVDYMKPIADTLSRYYRCIMLEQRGTGRSILPKYDSTTINMDVYVQDIEALRKHLKIKKFILIGNSWGSMLSFLYAANYLNNTAAVISLGSGPITNEYANVFDDNFRMRLLPHEKEIRDIWREKLKDSSLFLKANFERDKAGLPAYYYNRATGLKAAMAAQLTDVNYYVSTAFGKAHPKFDLRPLLTKITAPVLLVQGRQDVAGEANIYETHLLIKHSVLKFINRCGHIPWEEKPEEVWASVFDFLRTNFLFSGK